MSSNTVAVVGAAETTELGVIPGVSELQLHADAAFNALEDAGLKLADIDGFASAGQPPDSIAQYLGLVPKWLDGTSIGGSSFLLHVRHAVAAIRAGYCSNVLITHGESGRSGIGAAGIPIFNTGGIGEFEAPYGANRPANMFTIPVRRYLKTYGLNAEDLAHVAVIQREWAAQNQRATFKNPITVDDVMSSRMIADPIRLLMCCLSTDGGGALVLTSGDRARDFPRPPVYIIGSGEASEGPMVSQLAEYKSSRAFRVSGEEAFKEAGIVQKDVDHLMVYDAFAHVPLYGLEDLGFCEPGEAAGFVKDRHTAPGGTLPMNTNGGGLSYMHSGMYGMYLMQESIRQVRGIADAQIGEVNISVAHGVGGMFSVAGTLIFSSRDL